MAEFGGTPLNFALERVLLLSHSGLDPAVLQESFPGKAREKLTCPPPFTLAGMGGGSGEPSNTCVRKGPFPGITDGERKLFPTLSGLACFLAHGADLTASGWRTAFPAGGVESADPTAPWGRDVSATSSDFPGEK